MESLPNEILEIIGLYLDIPSISRLRQVARRFVSLCDDDIFWRNKFRQDYPMYIDSRINTVNWLKRYRDIYYWQRRFNRFFPDLTLEATCVALWNGGDWREIYQDVKTHPLLIHPAIKRLCREIEDKSYSYHLISPSGNVTYRNLDSLFEGLSPIYGIQPDCCATFTITNNTSAIANHLFEYLRYNNLFVIHAIDWNKQYIQIRGTYVTQSNGAKIWFPRAARGNGNEPDIRLDYTCN